MTGRPPPDPAKLRADLISEIGRLGGQRAYARLTNTPRTTLQTILYGKTAPKIETLQRFATAANTASAFRSTGNQFENVRAGTTVVKPLTGSRTAFSRITAPKGARSFKLNVKDENYPRGFKNVGPFDLETDDPESAMESLGLDLSMIESVIFDIGAKE